MTILFRPIQSSDVNSVINLWQACGLTRPWNDPAADIALAQGRDTSDILVAANDSGIIASIMVGHDGHRAWVYYLAVRSDQRGKGIARIAMEAAEVWAKQRNMPKMHLMVRPENAAVIDLYHALGYENGETTMLQKWLDPAGEALFRRARS